MVHGNSFGFRRKALLYISHGTSTNKYWNWPVRLLMEVGHAHQVTGKPE